MKKLLDHFINHMPVWQCVVIITAVVTAFIVLVSVFVDGPRYKSHLQRCNSQDGEMVDLRYYSICLKKDVIIK